MAKQTITAIYDSREYANNAILMLRQAGIADAEVSPETAATGFADETEPRAKGFWASLEDMFGGSDDHHTYAEGVRRGGSLVVAHVEKARVDDAIEILERHGSVDLEERESAWRGEGWTGASAITGGGIANEGAGPLRSMTPAVDTQATSIAATGAASVAGAATVPAQAYKAPAAPVGIVPSATARTGVAEDVIQVAEESITVGKRAVNRGKVRIHSYVVETPFMQQVNLRDETVSVERRPVDRALGVADVGADAFRDRTIEMDEVDEEAVVAKTARVVEEIGIRKDVSDRTETITDTLRSTKVDIEDGRTAEVGNVRKFVATSDAAMIVEHMDVIASDGTKVGTVDHLDGPDRIKLAKSTSPDGQHHYVPLAWVDHVDKHVHLNKATVAVKAGW